MAWTIHASPDRFDEAVAQFRARVPMRAEDVVRLTSEQRRSAFWVASMNELAPVRTLFEEIDRAIAEGTPLDDFKKRVRQKLTETIGDDHLETVFRNAVQTAYNSGRWEQLTSPDSTLLRPYFLYDTVMDSRTSEVCKPLDGTVKAHDDVFWLSHWPPLHHRCRSSVRSIRRSEAERRGITEGEPSKPQRGFGAAPPKRGGDPRPPPGESPTPTREGKRRDPTLVAAHRRREEQAIADAHALETEDAVKIEQLKRQEPDHWYREYARVYGDNGAARAVSWGRAMEERGRALGLDEARDTYKALYYKHGIGASSDGTLFARLRAHGAREVREAATLGEAVSALELHRLRQVPGSTSALAARLDINEAIAASALLGHARSIAPSGDAIRYRSITWAGAVSAKEREDIAQIYDTSLNLYRQLGDESLKHGTTLKIEYLEGQRAFYSPSRRLIGLGDYRRRGAELPHEIGHVLEKRNALLHKRAQLFYEARTRGEARLLLRDLTGNPKYEDDEFARRDRFMNVYIGRDYEGSGTEITSMGVQYLWERRAYEMVEKDIEWLYFVLGQLAGKKVP